MMRNNRNAVKTAIRPLCAFSIAAALLLSSCQASQTSVTPSDVNPVNFKSDTIHVEDQQKKPPVHTDDGWD